MKKLSIEQKAKAYDEAFGTAQELYNNPASSQIGKDWICAIFPELKESENERIRKEIISHLKYLAKYCNESMPNVDKWLTWLEKQSKQKQWKPSEEQMEALEHFVRSIGESGYASPYNNNTKLLYSLLEQLKKLKE